MAKKLVISRHNVNKYFSEVPFNLERLTAGRSGRNVVKKDGKVYEYTIDPEFYGECIQRCVDIICDGVWKRKREKIESAVRFTLRNIPLSFWQGEKIQWNGYTMSLNTGQDYHTEKKVLRDELVKASGL